MTPSGIPTTMLIAIAATASSIVAGGGDGDPEHRLLGCDRRAQVTVEHVPEIDAVLLGERTIESRWRNAATTSGLDAACSRDWR